MVTGQGLQWDVDNLHMLRYAWHVKARHATPSIANTYIYSIYAIWFGRKNLPCNTHVKYIAVGHILVVGTYNAHPYHWWCLNVLWLNDFSVLSVLVGFFFLRPTAHNDLFDSRCLIMYIAQLSLQHITHNDNQQIFSVCRLYLYMVGRLYRSGWMDMRLICHQILLIQFLLWLWFPIDYGDVHSVK